MKQHITLPQIELIEALYMAVRAEKQRAQDFGLEVKEYRLKELKQALRVAP